MHRAILTASGPLHREAPVSFAEPLDSESVGGVNADRNEPFGTDGRKAVRRLRSDNDDVARTGNDLFPIHGHCRFAGANDASFGIGMLMQSRTFPRLKVADEERNAGTVGLAFELNRGDCALPLIAAMQDVEHSSWSLMPEGQLRRCANVDPPTA